MSTMPWMHRSMLRLAVMALVGIVVGVISGANGAASHAVVIGWAAASLVYVVWVWLVIGTMDPQRTASHAGKTRSAVSPNC